MLSFIEGKLPIDPDSWDTLYNTTHKIKKKCKKKKIDRKLWGDKNFCILGSKSCLLVTGDHFGTSVKTNTLSLSIICIMSSCIQSVTLLLCLKPHVHLKQLYFLVLMQEQEPPKFPDSPTEKPFQMLGWIVTLQWETHIVIWCFPPPVHASHF